MGIAVRKYQSKGGAAGLPNRLVLLVVCGTIILFTGTIYWGWAGMQELLYKAGAFEDVCVGASDTSLVTIGGVKVVDCAARKSRINSLFTFCYALHFMSSFLSGLILDNLGPRRCFMLGHFCSACAWFLILCFPKNPACLYIGFMLVGVFLEASYTPSIVTLCDVFPTCGSTVIATMGALRSVSFFMPALMSCFYGAPLVPLDKLYIIGLVYLTIGNGFALAVGCWIIPYRRLILPPLDPNEQEKKKKQALKFKDLMHRTRQNVVSAYNLVVAASKHPQCIEYLVLLLSTALFISSVEFLTKASREYLATTRGETAIEIFKYTNCLSFIPAPFMGYIMDRAGPAVIMHVLHWAALLHFVFVSIDVYAAKVLACCAYLFAASLPISSIYGYVNDRFTKRYFGTLVSVIFFFSGSLTLLNIPLYKMAVVGGQRTLRMFAFIMIGYLSVAAVLSLIMIYVSKYRQPNAIRESY